MGLEVIKQAPIYVSLDTKYNLVHWVATEGVSWRVVKPKDQAPTSTDWPNEELEHHGRPICDMFWSDDVFSEDMLLNLSVFQKVNHFPGMSMISNKLSLVTQLNKMKELFTNHYSIFPKSWIFP